MSRNETDWSTPGLLDALRDKWNAGKSASVIASELTDEFHTPIGKNAVCGKKNRLDGIARRPNPIAIGSRVVSEEKLKLVELMLRNGLSNNAIANRAHTGERTVRIMREELGIAPFRSGSGRVMSLLSIPMLPQAKPTYLTERPAIKAPTPRVVHVAKFSSVRTCTWIGGASGPDGPCDQKTAHGTAWCSDHGAKVFVRWPPRRMEEAA